MGSNGHSSVFELESSLHPDLEGRAQFFHSYWNIVWGEVAWGKPWD
jgi:hypothetical protein